MSSARAFRLGWSPRWFDAVELFARLESFGRCCLRDFGGWRCVGFRRHDCYSSAWRIGWSSTIVLTERCARATNNGMSNDHEAGEGQPVKASIGEQMRRIRALVKPENCARSRKLARKAANARWAKVREKNALQVAAV